MSIDTTLHSAVATVLTHLPMVSPAYPWVEGMPGRWLRCRIDFPESLRGFRDRRVTLRTRFLRPTRALARLAFDRADRLSDDVEQVRDIRFRRLRTEHLSFGEKWHRFLHSCHSIKASALIGLLAFVAVLGTVVVYGIVTSRGPVAADARIAGLLGMVITIAEVIGGAAGILFAVSIFGIQFHGERLGLSSFLVRYLGRREGLVPIAAFVLAIVAANVVAALTAVLYWPTAALALAHLDLILVPIAVSLVLWLLYRMVVSVTGDFFHQSVLPGLGWEYSRVLDEDAWHATAAQKFLIEASSANIEYVGVGGWSTFGTESYVRFLLPQNGLIADVNLSALHRLGRIARETCPEYETILCFAPGETADRDGETKNFAGLVLRPRRDPQDQQRDQTKPPSDAERCAIQRALERVFRVRRRRDHDAVDVMRRFTDVLVNQARYDRADQLTRALDAHESLIELRLTHPDRPNRRPDTYFQHRTSLPDYLGGFGYVDLADAAIDSRDWQKIEAVIRFGCRVMYLSIEHGDARVFSQARTTILRLYLGAIKNADFADRVAKRLDGLLYELHLRLGLASELQRKRGPTELSVIMAELSWLVHLVKCALEAGRSRDAQNFLDRLGRQVHRNDNEQVRMHHEQRASDEMRVIYDLHRYAHLVLAAWCLHLVREKKGEHDTARVIFRLCLSWLGSRHALLATWERLHARKFDGEDIDKQMGIIGWGLEPIERAGDFHFGWGRSDEWLTVGLVAGMLARPAAQSYALPNEFNKPPPFEPHDASGIERTCRGLLEDQTVPELLGIAPESIDQAVQAVAEMFRARTCLYKLDHLTAVLETEIDSSRVNTLEREVISLLGGEESFYETMKSVGVSSASSSVLPDTVHRLSLHRRDIISGDLESTADAASLAHQLTEVESEQLAELIEILVPTSVTCSSLSELPGAAVAAITSLRARGFSPNSILLPPSSRFVYAVTRQRFGGLQEQGALGRWHVGKWERCHVLMSPSRDCRSVLVFDSVRFVHSTPIGETHPITLTIEDAPVKNRDEYLAQMQSEGDPAKIPSERTIRVAANCFLATRLGIGESVAAVRIELDVRALGYAVRGGDEFYHRPDCEVLHGDAEVAHVIFPYGRRACGRCNPLGPSEIDTSEGERPS